jgi:hypothetical protein
MVKGGGSSTVLAVIARHQAQIGNVTDALRTIKKIPAPEVRCDALRGVAEQQASKGYYAGMRETLDLASVVCPDKDPHP